MQCYHLIKVSHVPIMGLDDSIKHLFKPWSCTNHIFDLLLSPDENDICISGILIGAKPRYMLIENWFPESLDLQKMKNYYRVFCCYFAIFGFISLRCWPLQHELERDFTGMKFRGQQTPTSLHRIVSDDTCSFHKRPRNVVLQEEFYFYPKFTDE